MAFERLFQPITIGSHKVKNRIVFPPCVMSYGGKNGEVTDAVIAYYEARARGGVGTVIVEAAFIRPDGRILPLQPGIHDDSLIPGLRRLAEAIKRHGALAVIQINHIGRQGKSKFTGFPIVSSSAVPSPTFGETPRALSTEEIEELVGAYAAAAARAQQAGFDGVEVHGGHGYLVAQFMSPYVNQREDEYGGDPVRRMRFALEVVAAIRQRCGTAYPIFFRFSGDEYVQGGLTLADWKANVQPLVAAGVDVLDVSAGVYETLHITIPMASEPRGCLVHLAEAIKPLVNVPVITVGKITDPEYADGVLAAGRADMVAIGRGLFADPEFPNEAASGRVREIQKCTGCRACTRPWPSVPGVRCATNPMLGHELQFAQPIEAVRDIAVVGSGPAGLQAASVAALRGHRVTLWVGDRPLGGELAGASGPTNFEAAMILKSIAGKLGKLGVAVRRDAEIDCTSRVVLVEEGLDGALPASLSRQTLPVPGEPRQLMAVLEAGTLAGLAI